MGEVIASALAETAQRRPLGSVTLARERIALCDYPGHAFPAELSREFARRGHDVRHLYFAEFQSPKGQLRRLATDPCSLSIDGVSLGRAFSKYNLARRRYQEIEIGRRFAAEVAAFSPDVVIGCNMPLDTRSQLVERAKRIGARFVFWQQDIYSIAIEKILTRKFGPAGAVIGRHYRRLEKSLLDAADSIVVISPDFVSALDEEFGVSGSKIHVIENWAPLGEVRARPKVNDWSRKYDVHDKEVVLYTGTLGMKHDPSLLLALACRLQARKNAVLVVVSEGPAAKWLAQSGAGLSSLRVLPFQPYSEYSNVLGSADVLVAILEPDAGVFSVPSKILSYLCSGRPIVLSAPASNLASRTVEQSGAGIAVSPESRGQFISAVTGFLDRRPECINRGRAGRTYAEYHFDITTIGERFAEIVGSGAEESVENENFEASVL